MYLTGTYKLRANNHDRRRLRIALARWQAGMAEAMGRADARRQSLLRCLVMKETARGQRLVIDGKAAHAFTLECCRGLPEGLHSSTAMSLIVAVEEQLKSYLGLYLDWVQHGRKTPKPQFPAVAPGSVSGAAARWETALEGAGAEMSLQEENAWRAEVTRASRAKRLPFYFGAATSGAATGQAHCGLIRREDGRVFALLTLWPAGSALGEPVTRARNRTERGACRNLRAEKEFAPTERARASLMVPLEFSQGQHGRENMFLRRAVPKSAEVVAKGDEYYLHVAFEFPDREKVETPNVLAVRRGIAQLLTYAAVDPEGRDLARGAIDGKELISLVSAIKKNRATKDQKGRPLAGDRRLARVTEHHLYSAAHQIIHVARQQSAAVVLLNDRNARRPQKYLAYRHFSRMAEILSYLAEEAGLPEVREREIYGSRQTCPRCGWRPGDKVVDETIDGDHCPGCRSARDPETGTARLLALDTLRLRRPEAERVPLGEFVRGIYLAEK